MGGRTSSVRCPPLKGKPCSVVMVNKLQHMLQKSDYWLIFRNFLHFTINSDYRLVFECMFQYDNWLHLY